MTKLVPASHFEEAVAALLLDWQGQDEMFYHDKSMRTIIWYVGKVKSYLAAEQDVEIRTHRKQFMEAVCREYGMQPRRLQEGLAVYKQLAEPSDSVMETANRIFQKYGGWSKALPPKAEKEVEEKCNHTCSIHQ